MEVLESIKSNGMYLSIKEESLNIINNDIELFRSNPNPKKQFKFSINTFLNRIFLNMCNKESVKKIAKELSENKDTESSIGTKRKKSSKGNTGSKKTSKKGFTIKINNTIINRIESTGIYCKDKEFYAPDVAKYYKFYIEQYTSLPLTEREKIFYKDFINRFEEVKQLQKIISIKKVTGFQNSNTKNISNEIAIYPYKIETSNDNACNYITGFALNGRTYSNIICIPLHRILLYEKTIFFDEKETIEPDKEIIFKTNSYIKNYSELTSYIQNRLDTDGVLYISGSQQTVRVKLSDKGLEWLYLRPQYKPHNISIDKENPNIISFQASQLQTFMYFFKFGAEAEILEPTNYRDDFRKRYQAALSVYQEN